MSALFGASASLLFADSPWWISAVIGLAVLVIWILIDKLLIGKYFMGKGKRLRAKRPEGTHSRQENDPVGIEISGSQGVTMRDNHYFGNGTGYRISDSTDIEASGNTVERPREKD